MKKEKVSKLDRTFDEDYVWHISWEDEREVLNIFEGLQQTKESMLEYGSCFDSSYN